MYCLEEPINNRNDLIEWFELGCKPKSDFKIGTEHEKFVYINKDLSPVGYKGDSGIEKILKNLTRFGWKEVYEKNTFVEKFLRPT